MEIHRGRGGIPVQWRQSLPELLLNARNLRDPLGKFRPSGLQLGQAHRWDGIEPIGFPSLEALEFLIRRHENPGQGDEALLNDLERIARQLPCTGVSLDVIGEARFVEAQGLHILKIAQRVLLGFEHFEIRLQRGDLTEEGVFDHLEMGFWKQVSVCWTELLQTLKRGKAVRHEVAQLLDLLCLLPAHLAVCIFRLEALLLDLQSLLLDLGAVRLVAVRGFQCRRLLADGGGLIFRLGDLLVALVDRCHVAHGVQHPVVLVEGVLNVTHLLG